MRFKSTGLVFLLLVITVLSGCAGTGGYQQSYIISHQEEAPRCSSCCQEPGEE